MKCKDYNLELCNYCSQQSAVNDECMINTYINIINIFNNFDLIFRHYSNTDYYWTHFLKALELTNPQWHDRLTKLIILK
jgi:hypothetical protein